MPDNKKNNGTDLDLNFYQYETERVMREYCLVNIENTRVKIEKLKEMVDISKEKKDLKKLLYEKEEQLKLLQEELNFLNGKEEK